MLSLVSLAKVAVLAASVSLSGHAHYTVQPGDTLSAIAASHSVPLSSLEAANPQIADPNLIYAGQVVNLGGGGGVTVTARHGDGDADRDDGYAVSAAEAPSAPAPAPQASTPAPAPQAAPAAPAGSGGGSLADVPGVPRSFAACVAFRESTNGQLSSNVYGIVPSSGYNGYAMSLAQQKATFALLYTRYGTAPWHPSDGC